MTMIKCLMIGKDRHVTTVKVDSRKEDFVFNNGLYTIPKEAVNLAEFAEGKQETYPELIYVESVALPVNKASGDVSGFLTKTVVGNALKQVAQPRSDFMSVIMDYMRNPNKLIMVAFAGIIVLAVLRGFLFP
jgi:hypothetical protein